MTDGLAEKDRSAAIRIASLMSWSTIAFVAVLLIATVLFLNDSRLDGSQREKILSLSVSTLIVWILVYFFRLWQLSRSVKK